LLNIPKTPQINAFVRKISISPGERLFKIGY
jgi:hypothetical protein